MIISANKDLKRSIITDFQLCQMIPDTMKAFEHFTSAYIKCRDLIIIAIKIIKLCVITQIKYGQLIICAVKIFKVRVISQVESC